MWFMQIATSLVLTVHLSSYNDVYLGNGNEDAGHAPSDPRHSVTPLPWREGGRERQASEL